MKIINKLTLTMASGFLTLLSNSSVFSQTTIDQTTFNNVSLTSHNTYRTTHKTPNLVFNDSLSKTAKSWAENIASTGVFAHSTPEQRNGAGENLYVYYTTATSVAADTLAKKAVQSWYDEVANYNYNNPGFSSNTGHFTQVVWKNSTKLGCGTGQGTKTINGTQYNAFYVVCHYDPAGNMQGDFPNNVLKP